MPLGVLSSTVSNHHTNMNTPQFIGRRHQEQAVSAFNQESPEIGVAEEHGPTSLPPIDRLRQLLDETEGQRPLDYPWGH